MDLMENILQAGSLWNQCKCGICHLYLWNRGRDRTSMYLERKRSVPERYQWNSHRKTEDSNENGLSMRSKHLMRHMKNERKRSEGCAT